MKRKEKAEATMIDPMIASGQSFIRLLRADLGIELVPSAKRPAEKAEMSPAQTVRIRKRAQRLSIWQVPNQGDIGEKKSDVENSKECDSDIGDGR